ncbi:MAG TPA: SIMPL domain-containing protein [Aquella sp.]|nr:SIMPL domain-containing protein [Aquella sp.]
MKKRSILVLEQIGNPMKQRAMPPTNSRQGAMRNIGVSIWMSMMLAAPAISYAKATDAKTVTATGRGEVFIPQTIATARLSVSEDGKTAIEAQEKVRTKSAKLLKVLKNEKTLNLETTSVTVNPNTSYTDNKPKIIGYNANYTVEVKALIENVGAIIDDAVSAGATIVDEPKLTPSNSEIAKAENNAIKLATQNAKSRAEASLDALGFKPIGVNQITVLNISNQPHPLGPTLMRSAENSGGAPATEVVAGKTDIVAEVSLSMTY